MYNVKKNKGFLGDRKHIKVYFDRYDKNPPFETILTCSIPIGFYILWSRKPLKQKLKFTFEFEIWFQFMFTAKTVAIVIQVEMTKLDPG